MPRNLRGPRRKPYRKGIKRQNLSFLCNGFSYLRREDVLRQTTAPFEVGAASKQWQLH
jgi:hypothetical protein